jgi:hypothetical protein
VGLRAGSQGLTLHNIHRNTTYFSRRRARNYKVLVEVNISSSLCGLAIALSVVRDSVIRHKISLVPSLSLQLKVKLSLSAPSRYKGEEEI